MCPTSTKSCTVNLSSTHVLKIESTEISDMKDDLQKFWNLETLGMKEREASVYDKFSSDIRFTGERYQVKLPFKDNHPMLPDNYSAASRRLTTTTKAAVYMRVEYESKVECQIISSKTRVAPLAKQTIPRLELLSNLAASRLLKSVSQALEAVRIDNVFNWTDSMISLWWITNTNKEYKQFVENRVAENRRNSPPQQWRYCLTAENPADIASREIKATDLKGNSLWLHGTEFLLNSSEHWPKQPENVQVREELCELKSSKSTASILVTTCVEDKEEEASLANVIKSENFSSVTKLLRVTAQVLLFVEKLKKAKSREGMEEDPLRLYRQAEKRWIEHV